VKKRRNAQQSAHSERPQDTQSRARSRQSAKSGRKSRISESGVEAQAGAELVDSAGATSLEEIANDGRIRDVLNTLLAKMNERDAGGRFTSANTAHLQTLEHSAQLWVALEPLKLEMTTRVRAQLAADGDDAAETLLGTIDAYVEARLLRSSAFVRLCQLGGFMTSKGRARALLSTWGSAFDREMRAAEKLGLERRARRVSESVREFLDRERAEREQHDDAPNDAHDDGQEQQS
jgi:hypothetical protein